MVVRLSCTYDNFNISDKELQFTVLNTIKTLFGDFGVGAIKTCFKGTNLLTVYLLRTI